MLCEVAAIGSERTKIADPSTVATRQAGRTRMTSPTMSRSSTARAGVAHKVHIASTSNELINLVFILFHLLSPRARCPQDSESILPQGRPGGIQGHAHPSASSS